MKRIYNKPSFNIYGGVSIHEGKVRFDWSHDSENDVVHLVSSCSGEFDIDGIRYAYGYEYADNAKKSDKKIFRNYLKSLTPTSTGFYSENIDQFVERAILRFDERYPLDSFGATVHTELTKSPSLTEVMQGYFWEYMHNLDVDFSLVKETYKNVKFDTVKAIQALVDSGMSLSRAEKQVDWSNRKFTQLKSEGKLFQMKAFVPREIRSGFSNFLRFKTEEERKVYETLQGTNVLIYDDFLTSGATVKEIIRYLKAIHDKNTLTVFVLIKQ